MVLACTALVLAAPASAVEGTIAPGGPPVTVTIVNPGENATLTFDGTAGQRVSLEISDVTIGTSVCCSTKVSIVRPDGKTLVSTTVGTNGGFIDAVIPPLTGTYSIVVDPQSTSTGSATVHLLDVPPDTVGTIAIGGAPVTVTTTAAGQNATLSFSGTAAQRISLEISDVTIGTSVCCSTRVSIVRPDGKMLTSATVGTTGGFVDAVSLPLTGTYSVLVDPQSTSSGSAMLRLYDVPGDALESIVIGGLPVTTTTTVPGQNAKASFTGIAGQRVSLEVFDVTVGSSTCCSTKVSIVRPDGRTLTSATVGSSGGFIDAVSLPLTGTYSVAVDPLNAGTGSVTLRLYDVPPDVTATAVPGGASMTVTTTVPGQNAKLTFDAVAGQRVSISVGPSCCTVRISVLKPNGGTLVGAASFGMTGGFVDATTIPTIGTYTVLVDPQGAGTGSTTLRLYDVPADVTASIVPGGPAVTVTTTVPGQNAKVTFDGIAGQRVSVRVGSSCCPTRVSILKPNGVALVSSPAFGASGGFVDSVMLPTSGTYSILVDPQGAETGSVTLQLFDVPSDVTASASIGGPSVTATTTVPGQNAAVTFDGVAGQRMSLAVEPGCCSVKLTILKPNGATLVSPPVFGPSGGFLDTLALPNTGTYTIVVDPQGAATGGTSLRLYDVPADVAATIVPGGPAVTVTTTVPGQNANLTFDGVAGQRVSVRVGPSCCTTKVSLLKPDGLVLVSVTSFAVLEGFLEATTLPTSGTYTLLVDPQGSTTGNVTIRLYDVPADVTGTIAFDSPLSVTLSTPGQNARFTFAGTAGQTVSLDISNVSIGTSLSGTVVSILRPDGSVLATTSLGTSGGFIDAKTLPSAGTYTVVVDPQGSNTGNATLTLLNIPVDVTGTISAGGPAVTVTTTASGQNARVTFSGVAGQRVSLAVGPNCCLSHFSILKPDGTTLVSPVGFGTGGGFVDTATLPAAGTYTIFVDPQGSAAGDVTLTLYDVPADASAAIAPDGVPVSVATSVPGQNAVATFSGTAGQKVSIRLGPTCCAARVTLRSPDGSTLVSPPTFGTGGGFIDTTTLPATGTYAIAVDPQGAAVGSMTLAVWDVPPDVTGSATLGGSAVTVTTTTPGQNGVVTFAGAAGDGVSVVVGPFNCCSTRVSLLASDGTTLAGPASFNPDGGRLLARLPAAGTYAVFVDPQGAGEGALHVRLELDNTAPAPPLLTLMESFPDSHVVGATFFYRPAGGGGSFTVSATASDGGTGLDKITFPGLAGGFTPTAPIEDKLAPYAQTYSWGSGATYANAVNLVTAYDKVGNTSTTAFSVTADSDAPVTTDNTGAIGFGWKNTTQTVILSPSDGTGSGAARSHYTTDGSTPTTSSTQGSVISLATDGVYTVKYFSIDNVTNVEAVKTASTQIRIDKTPPSSSTLDPLPSVIKNGQVLTGSGTDTLSGLASVAYYYCAGSSCAPSLLIGSSSSGPTHSVTWSSQPADGTYQVVARAIDAAGNTLDSAKRTVTIDNTAPNTTITASPPNPTNSTSASFSFTSTEAGSTFQCALDGAPFASCTSPQGYTGLTAGSHTFQVRATDPVGNTDATPASFTWTVDLTPPNTSITASPPNPSNSASASFSFTSTEAGSSFQCALDGAAFASCTSPRSYSGLAAGSHTFEVRATDPAGNQDATPASYTWTVDLTAPDTAITASPPNPTGVTSASFEFASTEPGSSFQCQLDGGAFSSCTSPKAYSGLADGSHTFQVRAVDPAGNTDPSPASYTWTVDTTAPNTSITASPPNPTNSTSASFSFTSTEAGSSFECALDGAAFASCSSPQGYTGLAAGSHTFEVRATDAAGNTDASPASFTWTVDDTAPDTTITSAPSTATNLTSATFSFTSSEAGSTFHCSLDGAPFSGCSSPRTYAGLTEGSHTFDVRATDQAGNTDPTPASHAWTVDLGAPDTTVASGPLDPTSATSATFVFSSNEAGSTFECQLDGGGYGSCASQHSYTGLAAGVHTFQVRATDEAGNTDPSPASFTWTIDLTAPDTTIGSSPADPTNATTASFTFSASEAGSTFECSLDWAAFTSCSSPESYSGLAEGSHTFEVRSTDQAGNTDATPATRTWTVDLTAPAAPLIESPPEGSTSNTGTITLAGTAEAGSFVEVFEGASSKGGSTANSSGNWSKTLTGVADGSHTYTAKATDAAGNTSTISNARTVVVDMVAPNTTIGSGPLGSTAFTTATFTFSADDPAATFECSLDGMGFASCTSPRTYTALSEGSHTFRVQATDSAGNTDPTPATRTWTVDTTAPAAPAIATPADGSLNNTGTVTVAGTAEAGSFVEIFQGAASKGVTTANAGGNWTRTLTGVAEGSHTYVAEASDAAGNTSPASNAVTVTVDKTAPNTTIDTAPSSPTTSTSASFSFSATEAGSTFQCSLDGGAFSACASPESYTALSDGGHTFQVRATDPAGNADTTPASHSWTVDTTAPQTTIDSGPLDPTSDTTATFTFSSSESGTSFECSLDGAAFAPCSSPETYSGLAAGPHTFDVKAVDAAGNTDATPATHTWTVT